VVSERHPPSRVSLSFACVLAIAATGPWTGCASSGSAPPPQTPAPQYPAPPQTPVSTGPTAGQRAASALEGALMGFVIGSYAGPIGAAVGAGTFLLYSAVTGSVPLSGGGGSRGPNGYPGGNEADREETLEDQIDDELTKQASLEDEIEAELRRQEELLAKIDQDEQSRRASGQPATEAPSAEAVAQQANPRAAPAAPKDRSIDLGLFDHAKVTVEKGAWGDNGKMQVERRALDADRDGKPEEIRYFDAKTGAYVRREEDRNYDGAIDAWVTLENGAVVARQVDESGDGKPDAWETYAGGLMTSREVDRNADGVRDAFYRYAGDSLVEERHDGNDDGKVDLVVAYENRVRVRTEEDTTKDGTIDTWTTYASDGTSGEVVTRIERDKAGRGKADVVETFGQQGGKTVLVKREEDVNGDGKVDVTSSYENGKLKSREVADPALVPL